MARLTEPSAQVLAVDCSRNANVFAILAAVGATDDDSDEASEFALTVSLWSGTATLRI
ncbi:hypothetical protein ACIGEZ_32050 [Streptomyces sp. NPDC085481]|uniref:hypothetical protein n=1 Tax=Streptomyces sp. NPDC085481 TaxID=3365727 RepID=UPI0037D85DF6